MPSQTTAPQDCAAGVIPAAPWRLKAVSALPGYRLAVTFQDDRTGIIDCSAVTTSPNAGIYSALADPSFFEQVRLELGAITWPNGADLDPAWLYDMLKNRSVPF